MRSSTTLKLPKAPAASGMKRDQIKDLTFANRESGGLGSGIGP
jgi:hypothetical protein